MKTFLTVCLLSAALAASPVLADPKTKMASYAEAQRADWLTQDTIIAAIRAQNDQTAAYDQAQIDALDTTWRSEVGSRESALISSVITSDAAQVLSDAVDASGGVITEVFVMDARGLNVASSGVTSDYWQGDEAKFQQTFPVGADAVHVADVELDESTQAYQGQVSMTISDPATGEPIGAVTFGLNAQSFF
ncbi:MAG: hypothetical protein AAFY38_02750 [Pseudomonadota bacterium]